jgi:hypothetical protein
MLYFQNIYQISVHNPVILPCSVFTIHEHVLGFLWCYFWSTDCRVVLWFLPARALMLRQQHASWSSWVDLLGGASECNSLPALQQQPCLRSTTLSVRRSRFETRNASSLSALSEIWAWISYTISLRPQRRWKDNIKMDLIEKYIKLDHIVSDHQVNDVEMGETCCKQGSWERLFFRKRLETHKKHYIRHFL